MRRRAPAAPTTSDVPPAALRVGPLADVWAADGTDLLAARRAWNDARTAWLAERGLDVAEGCRLLAPQGPWRLSDPGADARLSRAGVTWPVA